MSRRPIDDFEAFRRAQRVPSARLAGDEAASRASRVDDILSVFDRTFTRRAEVRETDRGEEVRSNQPLIEELVEPLRNAIDRLRTRLALRPDPAAIQSARRHVELLASALDAVSAGVQAGPVGEAIEIELDYEGLHQFMLCPDLGSWGDAALGSQLGCLADS